MVIYQNVVLSVSVPTPRAGDRISITLSKRAGKDVAWSTGEPFSTASGISLSSITPDRIPVSRFYTTNSVVAFILPPCDSGSPVMFNAQAFLVAVPDIEEFVLTMSTDQGSTVVASLPGRMPIELSDCPIVFDWKVQ